jgi:phosphate starvation-inducible PhoH-like protein
MTKRNRRNACDEFFTNDFNHLPNPNIKKFTIKYLNSKQKEYGKIISNNTIIFAIGSAGSGKTFIAALHAMDDFLAQKIDKIVICRPVINAGGEELGFLPGDLHEKMDPYIKPIFDAFSIQWNQKQIQTMLEYGKIEIAPLAFLRGRTFKNSFIICDEAQNATDEQLIMLLSRLGEGSKMVITGDPSQKDITGKPFEKAYRKLSNINDIAFINFTNNDIVRHELVQKILASWTNSNEETFLSTVKPLGLNQISTDA